MRQLAISEGLEVRIRVERNQVKEHATRSGGMEPHRRFGRNQIEGDGTKPGGMESHQESIATDEANFAWKSSRVQRNTINSIETRNRDTGLHEIRP